MGWAQLLTIGGMSTAMVGGLILLLNPARRAVAVADAGVSERSTATLREAPPSPPKAPASARGAEPDAKAATPSEPPAASSPAAEKTPEPATPEALLTVTRAPLFPTAPQASAAPIALAPRAPDPPAAERTPEPTETALVPESVPQPRSEAELPDDVRSAETPHGGSVTDPEPLPTKPLPSEPDPEPAAAAPAMKPAAPPAQEKKAAQAAKPASLEKAAIEALASMGLGAKLSSRVARDALQLTHLHEDLPQSAALMARLFDAIEHEAQNCYAHPAAPEALTTLVRMALGPKAELLWPKPGDPTGVSEVVGGGQGWVDEVLRPGFVYTDETGVRRRVPAVVTRRGQA